MLNALRQWRYRSLMIDWRIISVRLNISLQSVILSFCIFLILTPDWLNRHPWGKVLLWFDVYATVFGRFFPSVHSAFNCLASLNLDETLRQVLWNSGRGSCAVFLPSLILASKERQFVGDWQETFRLFSKLGYSWLVCTAKTECLLLKLNACF